MEYIMQMEIVDYVNIYFFTTALKHPTKPPCGFELLLLHTLVHGNVSQQLLAGLSWLHLYPFNHSPCHWKGGLFMRGEINRWPLRAHQIASLQQLLFAVMWNIQTGGLLPA